MQTEIQSARTTIALRRAQAAADRENERKAALIDQLTRESRMRNALRQLHHEIEIRRAQARHD